MQKKRGGGNRGGDNKKSRRFKKVREPAECRFCRDKTKYIDYKDVEVVGKLLTQRGKIFSRKRSGNCAKHQRRIQNAVKLARYMALLPYVN